MKIFRKLTAAIMSITMLASAFGAFNLTASAANQSTQYTGSPIEPKIGIFDNDGTELIEGTDFDFSYENNVNVGTAYIVVTYKGNYDGEKRIPFDIIPRVVTAEKTTIDSISDQTFTGSGIEPQPGVKYNNKDLEYDKDYEYSYENNTDTGTATVNVNFKGNYTGSIPTYFTINKRALTADDITIAPIGDVVYTGQELQPDVSIKFGDMVLEKDKDFTLTYENNTEKGTADVKIEFICNFIGDAETTFRIVEKVLTEDDVTISDIPEQVFTGTAIEPKPEVKYGDFIMTEEKEYILDYVNNTNKGNATVRVLFQDDYAGEIDKTFVISSKTLTEDDVTATIANQTYTGKVLTPDVDVKHQDKTLVKDVDYTVEYTDNTDVGTGKAKITFIGNYIGEIEVPFNIVKAATSGGGGGGSSYSYNVTVTDNDGKNITVSKKESNNTITLTLPKGKNIVDGSQYTITAKKRVGNNAASGITVVLKDKDGNEVKGTTNENGIVVLPDTNIIEPVTDPVEDEDNMHTAYISGYDDGSFGPDSYISRSETAAMLYRVLPEWYSDAFKEVEAYFDSYFADFDTEDAEEYTSELFDIALDAENDENIEESALLDGLTDLYEEMLSILPFEVTEPKEFTDTVAGAWYEEAVEAMSSMGFINGYTDDTFRPDNYITRAEFVTIIMQNKELPDFDSVPFTDISEDLWSAKCIEAAYKAGYIDGYDDGTFRPDAYITRAEAVKIINSVLGREDTVHDTVIPFNDVSLTHWAYDQISEAAITHEIREN